MKIKSQTKKKMVLYGIALLIIVGVITSYCADSYIEMNSPDHIPDDIFGDENIFWFGFWFLLISVAVCVFELAHIISYFAFEKDKREKIKTVFNGVSLALLAVSAVSVIIEVLLVNSDFMIFVHPEDIFVINGFLLVVSRIIYYFVLVARKIRK